MLNEVERVRRFNRFYTNYLGILDETLLDSTVTLTEGRILYEIRNTSNCSAKNLIESLRLNRGYMSRILKRLERIGLIERATDPGDKRIRILQLTYDGRLIMRRIDRSATNHIEDILKPLHNVDRNRLITAMREIEDILSV